ncbi:MAG: 2-polyprenyl-3-methyl-6-methoxy-1,4-benzoquinone monooxygenase [Steroidobacteraceae bacterium]|jgi:ubiquinone biosynthesis monooxygenase Coq7
MGTRTFSFADRLIGEIDKAINVLCSPAHSARPLPGSPGAEWAPDEADRRESCRLMRVNHAGEVAAQALYRGQALTARNEANAETMRQAADEEADHLAWCEIRIKELKGRTSVLNPLWYAGSFLIGAAAGLSGERTGLGFITETERQVESHLRGHLDRLPAADLQSRAIIEQMTHDEIRHGAKAASLGGREPPIWIQGAMHLASRVMTGGSRWA